MPPRRRTLWGDMIGKAIIGMLATLALTGIISTVSMSLQVARLTTDVAVLSQTLSRHLEHSVDKDEYLRRDAQIQHALDTMATKDDIRDLRAMIESLKK